MYSNVLKVQEQLFEMRWQCIHSTFVKAPQRRYSTVNLLKPSDAYVRQ